MNIQIFGKSKCFDTKKAERYFKERNIRYQSIDMGNKGISRGELESVMRAVGGIDVLVNEKQAHEIRYFADEETKIEKLLENPKLFRTPIVRNGRQATVGYRPEVWKTWE